MVLDLKSHLGPTIVDFIVRPFLGDQEWFYLTGAWDSIGKDVVSFSAKTGKLDLLQWARKHHRYPWGDWVCSMAAENGHLEVLKWARENGCPWSVWTCSWAARNGHLEILKWARENGCQWDEITCAQAALNGHIEVLQWARENGCPWGVGICTCAAENGHLEVLQWGKKMVARGMKELVYSRQLMVTWNYCNGHKKMVVHGNENINLFFLRNLTI